MMTTTIAATTLVLAFFALSFFGWHRQSSHHQVFGDIALFIAGGLLAKAVPLLGAAVFVGIIVMSLVRYRKLSVPSTPAWAGVRA